MKLRYKIVGVNKKLQSTFSYKVFLFVISFNFNIFNKYFSRIKVVMQGKLIAVAYTLRTY